MEYRVGSEDLFATLRTWDELIPGRGKIHLIACGGTAATLLGYKESTKDVDFLVPNESEYKRLVRFLEDAGYARDGGYGWRRPEETIRYDLFLGKAVYSTELLTSPLSKGGHKKIREWNKIYVGILNPIDLIISKMFRGSQADIDDCLTLLKHEKVDLKKLERRFKETAKYDVSESKVLGNYNILLERWKEMTNRGDRK